MIEDSFAVIPLACLLILNGVQELKFLTPLDKDIAIYRRRLSGDQRKYVRALYSSKASVAF